LRKLSMKELRDKVSNRKKKVLIMKER